MTTHRAKHTARPSSTTKKPKQESPAPPPSAPARKQALRKKHEQAEAPAARLTHVDAHGRLTMVDVSAKPETPRVAIARGLLRCTPSTRDALVAATTAKGEALATAKVAGILGAKHTGSLIPLCHPVPLTDVAVDILAVDDGLALEARAACIGRTGVEMEAMVAVTVAGLTLYDMGKAAERGMVLEQVRLVEKRGGKSGVWRRAGEA
jgi:cyclic pyranopterin phosphate synthase